jgi:hypothetical protein
MLIRQVSRRRMVGTAAGLAAMSVLRPVRAATPLLDLDVPENRARIRAKIMASAGDETVYTFYRLHTFAYLHEGNVTPLFSTHVLNARVCKPTADPLSYSLRTYEVGVVTKFDTDEKLELWENPYTGEKVKPWPLHNGPLFVTAGPDGIGTTGGSTLKPRAMRIDIMGDQVFMPTVSAVTVPNEFQPSAWPKESSGPQYHWDSHFTYIAPLAEVADPAVLRTSTIFNLQNLGTWYPWMRMQQRPGRMYGRAFGRKLKAFDDMPLAARKLIEAQEPAMFELSTWSGQRDRDTDYMKANKPG